MDLKKERPVEFIYHESLEAHGDTISSHELTYIEKMSTLDEAVEAIQCLELKDQVIALARFLGLRWDEIALLFGEDQHRHGRKPKK
jgi:hypothetical protein